MNSALKNFSAVLIIGGGGSGVAFITFTGCYVLLFCKSTGSVDYYQRDLNAVRCNEEGLPPDVLFLCKHPGSVPMPKKYFAVSLIEQGEEFGGLSRSHSMHSGYSQCAMRPSFLVPASHLPI